MIGQMPPKKRRAKTKKAPLKSGFRRRPKPPAGSVIGSWSEILQQFKELEQSHIGIVFQRAGYQMQHAVAVWSLAVAEMARVGEPAPASHLDEAAAWEWLWLSAYPGNVLNWTRWAELAGLHPSRHLAVLERVLELRLVYPDGEVHRLALAWLNELTAKGFGRGGKESKSRATPPPAK